MDDLNPMMFEYLDGTPMWDGIERVMHYWSCRVSEVDFVDLDSPSEEIVTSEFIRWRQEWGSSFLSMPLSRPTVMTPSARTSLRDSATSDSYPTFSTWSRSQRRYKMSSMLRELPGGSLSPIDATITETGSLT